MICYSHYGKQRITWNRLLQCNKTLTKHTATITTFRNGVAASQGHVCSVPLCRVACPHGPGSSSRPAREGCNYAITLPLCYTACSSARTHVIFAVRLTEAYCAIETSVKIKDPPSTIPPRTVKSDLCSLRNSPFESGKFCTKLDGTGPEEVSFKWYLSILINLSLS